jgi:hypothetical protein
MKNSGLLSTTVMHHDFSELSEKKILKICFKTNIIASFKNEQKNSSASKYLLMELITLLRSLRSHDYSLRHNSQDLTEINSGIQFRILE